MRSGSVKEWAYLLSSLTFWMPHVYHLSARTLTPTCHKDTSYVRPLCCLWGYMKSSPQRYPLLRKGASTRYVAPPAGSQPSCPSFTPPCSRFPPLFRISPLEAAPRSAQYDESDIHSQPNRYAPPRWSTPSTPTTPTSTLRFSRR